MSQLINFELNILYSITPHPKISLYYHLINSSLIYHQIFFVNQISYLFLFVLEDSTRFPSLLLISNSRLPINSCNLCDSLVYASPNPSVITCILLISILALLIMMLFRLYFTKPIILTIPQNCGLSTLISLTVILKNCSCCNISSIL